jgi:hypothetical protein
MCCAASLTTSSDLLFKFAEAAKSVVKKRTGRNNIDSTKHQELTINQLHWL